MSLAHCIRTSVAVWLTFHGAIADKDGGELRRGSNIYLNRLQDEYIAAVLYCRARGIPFRGITVKARQVGMSTVNMAILYWLCRVQRSNAILIGDAYERSIRNLENMFWRYAENDTWEWGNTFDSKRKESKPFSNGSLFTTDTANENRAGASGTFQAMAMTEAAHFKETKKLSAAALFKACLACVPKHGFTFIGIESTANGEGNVFHKTFSKAITFEEFKRVHETGEEPDGWNGYIKFFLAWHEFAEYSYPVTDKQRAHIVATLTDTERKLMARFPHIDAARINFRRKTIASPEYGGNEHTFDEEYPSDPESAFLVTGGRVFNQYSIREMMRVAEEVEAGRSRRARVQYGTLDVQHVPGDARESAHWKVTDVSEAWLKVWEEPRIGCKYWMTLDPASGTANDSEGLDPDNHSPLMWRAGYYDTNGTWWPRRLVARLADCGEELRLWIHEQERKAACRWDADILIQRVFALLDWYGRPMLVPEENKDPGVIRDALKAGYSVYRQQRRNDPENKLETFYGWRTTPQNKPQMVYDTVRLIRERETPGDGVEIFDPCVVMEFKVFMKTKEGYLEAATGWHDDQLISCCMADATQQAATLYKERPVKILNTIEKIQRERYGEMMDPTYR